jgi:uncharacterized RDD family membrane protein YckC
VTQAASPSLAKRLACVLYDGLLLSALLLAATFPFVALTQGLEPSLARHLLQAYLFLVTGGYFTVFWRKGQTLAMKTWKLRLETATGDQPSWGQVWMRYLLACANLPMLGAGWWAALFRADRQFLQDHLAGTRLVKTA